MAPSHTSSDSSEADEPSGQANPMAASLAGLPLRTSNNKDVNSSTSNGVDDQQNAESGKQAQSGQLKDFLDLATTRSSAPADIAARLEQKRLEHEKQRELQKRAFEEQMKQLELEQEREERELMDRAGNGGANSNAAADDSSKPVRSRSGNDLASFNDKSEQYANPKSMPGTRRHSGEIKGAGGAEAKTGPAGAPAGAEGAKRKGAEGQPMLNSFLFDDELDADLQNSAWGGKYLQMNTDDDKFPILVRRDSYPGILSASSAALDLAPLSQTPSHAGRAFGPGGRTAPSEWPQFQGKPEGQDADGTLPSTTALPTGGANSTERHRSVTLDASSPAGTSSSTGGSGSPLPVRSGTGQLPPPRSGLGGVGATASGRSSPTVDKKLSGLDAIGSGKSNGYGVDQMTDKFSNFNIDTNAFGNDPTTGPFGGYVHDHGAFLYDGNAGQYGSMGANRFAGLRLEDLQGDMLPLCKDQFGCRYLQKKLEDGNPEHRDMIFNEIFPHFAELMTDPFANYLSQRLLEYATDEQRDALIESISGELVSISLNMHGTRAVQKMIDYLSTQRQVQSLILALNLNVVTLIKDLNGNHVIQKCLNHLPPEDNQFIYNAVATHCIEVATHRHGCCVLQRCIDHASESQRIQLVTEITYNSLTLVQDAFGNYVVQYVLDLNDNRFIEAIVRQFLGNVSALSAQKFSSNVVEKCIRVADATGRRAIIDELLNKQRLERLLRDSFANYVVQTALDYAEPAQRAQLIETIRPILPMIRNTPYGKRIQSKIQRETNEHHMGRGGYHGGHHGGHHMAPGGHFYGMPAGMHGMPPHLQHAQFQPHPHQAPFMGHMHAPPPHLMSPGLDSFGGAPGTPGGAGAPGAGGAGARGSPYLGGPFQAGPPPHMAHHPQNGSLGFGAGAPGQAPGFAPFPGAPPLMGGAEAYGQAMNGAGVYGATSSGSANPANGGAFM